MHDCNLPLLSLRRFHRLAKVPLLVAMAATLLGPRVGRGAWSIRKLAALAFHPGKP